MQTKTTQQIQKNLSLAINSHGKLPSQVFLENWVNFLFFDSDRAFVDDFAEKVQLLLKIEGGHCACIVDLDNDPNTRYHSFYFKKDTLPIEYQLVMAGSPMKADGWIYNFSSRYACISDVGDWCIYCKRCDELAVIAFREHVAEEKYKVVIEQLKAVEISYGIATQHLFSLSEYASAEWRESLLSSYQSTRSPYVIRD